MDSWNAHPTSGDIDLPPSGVITTHCVSSVIRPGRKSSQDPLQFVKIQAADLSKKAVELIRLAEEEKITKEKIKEVEEEWQSNLLNWKSKRRVTHVHSGADPFSSDDSSDKSSRPRVKTFSEILNEKAKSGHRIGYNLQRYMDDEDDDFSQYLSTNGGTSSASSGAESPIKSVDVESCSSPQSMISQSLRENTNNNNFSRREREDGEERDEKRGSSQTGKALITTNASSSPSTDEQASSTSKTITATNGKSSMNVNGRSPTSSSPSPFTGAASFQNGSEPNHSAAHHHHLSSPSKIPSSSSEKTLLVGGSPPSESTFVSSHDEEHLVGESSGKNGPYDGRNNNNDEDKDKERKSREQQKNVWNYLLQQDQEHRLRIHADDADDDDEEEEDGLNESGENDESDLQRQEQLINFRAKLSAFENLAKSERGKSLPSLSSSTSLHNREASSSASSTTSSGMNGCPGTKTSGGGIPGGDIHYTAVEGQQTGGGNSNCLKPQGKSVHPSPLRTQVVTQQQQPSNTTTINFTNGIATRNGNSDSNKLLIGHSSQHQQYQLSNDQHFKYNQQLETPLSSSSIAEQVTTQLSKTAISPNGVIVSSTTVVPSPPANSSHFFNNNNNNSCQQTTNSRSPFPPSASSLSSQGTGAIHGQQQQQYRVPRPPHSSSSSTSSSSSSSLLPHHQSIHHQRDFSNPSPSHPLFPPTPSLPLTAPISPSSNSNNNNHLAIHHHLQQMPVQPHQHQFLTNGNHFHHQHQQANGYGSSSSAGMAKSMATNGHNHHNMTHEKQLLYDQQNQYANQFVQSSLPYGVAASYVDPLAHPQQPSSQPQQHYFVLEEDRRTGQTVVVQEPLYSNQQPMYQQQQQSSHLPSNGFPQQQPQQHSLPLHGNGVYLPKPYSVSTSSLPPKKPLHSGVQSSSASTSRLPLTLGAEQQTAAPSSLSASGASQVHPSFLSGGGSDAVSAPTTHHPSVHPPQQQQTGYNKNHWLIQEAELRRQIAAAANGPSSTTTTTAGRKGILANNSQSSQPTGTTTTTATAGTKSLGSQTTTQSQQLTTIPVTSSEQIYENFNQSTQSVPLQQLHHPFSSTSSVAIVPHPVLPPTTAMSTTTATSSTLTHLHPPPQSQSHHHPHPHHHPVTQPGQLPQNNNNKQNMLSVSGRKKCSSCGDELGRGCAAMVIESLSLYYHINCFRCSVCHIQLGNGSCGTDVRVRNHKLHCNNCYSNDEAGLKFSRV